MAKNIAFFADGTWNGPEKDENDDGIPDPTNVFLLFDQLEGADTPETKLLQNEQEQVATAADGTVTQVSKYMHGVGDSRNVINKIIGGTFGAGVINRIVRGYTFISRTYKPGDRIYIAGFSRGAYTARALGGMICTLGLLKAERFDGLKDREEAYRLGVAAWTQYREKAGVKSSFLDFVRFKSEVDVTAADFLPDVGIETIGVWDTVGSLGIPDYNTTNGRSDLFQFANTKLSPKVRKGIHALSIDERRADFVPTLWDPRDGITEMWFAGAHSDVGGGYADRFLSDIALLWMSEELQKAGVKIRPGLSEVLKGNPLGDGHAPWDDLPWSKLPLKDRSLPAGAKLHPSVGLRRRGRTDYAPESLVAFLNGGGALA